MQLLCLTSEKIQIGHFGNLNEKNINDNKIFWKTIKPFLSGKVRLANKITLMKNKETIMGDYNTTE